MLPSLVDAASGTYIGESGAIGRWLIKKFGLAPDDLKLYATSEQSIETSTAVHAHFTWLTAVHAHSAWLTAVHVPFA